jgi:hypothetical protein
MEFDAKMINNLQLINQGLMAVPDYAKNINPPSLWAYYLTLPQFCRDHNTIRNILYAFEYHQPRMSIRNKEMAMNMACSFLVPIEGRLQDVIVQMAASHKIRLDMETGKQMMNELKMWRMDPVYVGDPDIEEGGDEAAEEAEIKRLLSQDGIDDDEDGEEVNPMEQALSSLGADGRASERRQIMSEESGVADY